MQNPLEDQDIELFAAGSYGDKGTFTNDDIDQIVANYDPSFHEAPACIGHPKDDMPAYGWVKSLKRVGDKLVGRLKDVVPAFAEAVKANLYKKRSIALYRGDKGLSLRHVAFLGAMPPEVKALADMKFKDNDNGEVIELTFQEETPMPDLDAKKIEDNLFTRLTTFFSEKFGGRSEKDGDKDMKAELAAGIEAAMKPIREAETARNAEFAEAKKKLAEAQVATRSGEAVARVKAKGAWVPAFDKMGLPVIFAALAVSPDTVTVEFGEGDKKESKKVSALEALVAFMEGIGQIVPKGRLVDPAVATEARAAGRMPANADPNSVKLAELAKEYMTKNKVSFAEALTAVSIQHIELTVPGGAAAGTV